MGSFKSGPLSSLLLLGLLAWIAVVLIAPQVDLPDTAFEKNNSPLAVHALTIHVPQENANGNALQITFSSAEASDLPLEVFFSDKTVEVPTIPPRILRC
jgi:hypothetical protein